MFFDMFSPGALIFIGFALGSGFTIFYQILHKEIKSR